MKEQFMFTGENRVQFAQDVNAHLKKGWVIVPGSLVVGVGAASVSNTYEMNRKSLDAKVVLVCVLEKEI